MRQACILDSLRTPRGKGKPDGALHEVTPVHLAAQTLAALQQRNALDVARLDDVVFGCVDAVGEQGGNIARMAALRAGYPDSVPGLQLNRYCGSGLEAVNFAAAKITAGMADLAIGGGVESMSRVPMGSAGGAWATDPDMAFRTRFVPQGVSADLMATRYGLSRRDCDEYAVQSQQRAARAWAEQRFADAVIPVHDILGLELLARDEVIREQTDLDMLAALKPAFAKMGAKAGFDSIALQRYPQYERIEHVHHAGNSSAIVDGAGAVLLGDETTARDLGLVPRARIVTSATVGAEPTLMLDGPTDSAHQALERAGMSVADIDLWEINEAFSSVVLAFMQRLRLDPETVNPNGGAIAMGHPLGATGAMLVGTLVDEMRRRDVPLGMVSLCEAAGMATSTIIELV